jgi:nicotinate-nucleotide adenylyltransferase
LSGTGLFGGAFDPPHNGHLELARRGVEHFAFDRLIVIVTASPGHRRVYLDPETRLRLAEAAFRQHEVVLDHHERTIDMLREQRWDDPIVLVGADQFAGFLAWKEPEAVLELARLGVATRPGFPRERLEPVLRALSQPERVEFFEIDPVDVASTEVRARIARGEPIGDLVPPQVARLIQDGGLYRRQAELH